MFFIKKLIETVMFPPGIIIAVLLLIAVTGRKKMAIFLLSLFFAVIIYAASLGLIANIIISPLQNAYPKPRSLHALQFHIDTKHTAVVVLSSGAYNSRTLDGDSFNRLFAGFLLQKKLGVSIILSGGRATSGIATSVVMRRVLLKLGIKKLDILIDDKSNDTFQNAKNLKIICKRHGFKKIIIVTSAYHMLRAMLLFKKAGFSDDGVIPYPVDYKTEEKPVYNIYDFFPSLGSLIISSEALHEYLGYLYYEVF